MLKNLLKNLSYTLLSNGTSFIISALVVILVPMQIGVEAYGFFQLYIFYVSYTNCLHFGWSDGILLRYGGEYYENLDKLKFNAQFRLFTLYTIIIGSLVCLASRFLIVDENNSLIVFLVGCSIFLALPAYFFQYILQSTNRIKEYATLVTLQKVVYIVIIILAIVFGTNSYLPMIYADLIGRGCSLVYGIYQCKDIVLSKAECIQPALKEVKENISSGINVTFAYIASSLIIGCVRLGIVNQWDVSTFGMVSLTISVSNLLMTFIRAVALVMFPALRRTDEKKIAGIYSKLRSCLMLPLLGMLIMYYPARITLSMLLPQYADSLKYMAILFPMCIFECKMSMLIETYLKTLRKEKWLLIVNLIAVGLSVVLTILTTSILHNLELALVSIVVLLAFRCVIAELLLSKVLKIDVIKDVVLELFISLIFVMSSWIIGGVTGVLIYLLFYIVYLIIKSSDIKQLIGYLKGSLHHK